MKYYNFRVNRNYHYSFNYKDYLILINIVLFFFFTITKENLRYIINFSSEVNLVIKGSGQQRFLSDVFYLEPFEVKVNGISNNTCKKVCDFEGQENNVTLYFDEPLNSCKYMFSQLKNIKEIDFSNFDFSHVTSMQDMFMNCTNLININFGNMNTSSLTNVQELFSYCEIIESIDLSHFNTSSVTTMYHMFFHCYALKSLTFPETFITSKVTTMDAMFSHCTSLISLNLSIFDVSNVDDMGYMFHGCTGMKYLDISHFSPKNLNSIELAFRKTKLIYLNLGSLEIINDKSANRAFEFVSTNIRICSNKPNMQNFLSSLGFNNNCSDICFIKNIKLDIINNTCIYSCKDNGYFYEENNICYNQCPEGTHPLIKNVAEENDIIEAICWILYKMF